MWLQILAGNARKVGSVRFERLNASEDRAVLGSETHNISHISRHRWEEQQDVEYGKLNEDERIPSWDSNGDSDASLSEDESETRAKTHNLVAESIDVDSITDSEAPNTSGLPFLGDQECDLSSLTQRSNCGLETDGMDVSTATAVDTLYTKWEKNQGTTERRRQRRRKHSVEATVELDRSRKFYVKRKESETGVKIIRKQNAQED